MSALVVFLFFFNDPAPTEIYTMAFTLSLHDARRSVSLLKKEICYVVLPFSRGIKDTSRERVRLTG